MGEVDAAVQGLCEFAHGLSWGSRLLGLYYYRVLKKGLELLESFRLYIS